MIKNRLYVADKIELKSNVWINDTGLINRFKQQSIFSIGEQVNLFNDKKEERLYRVKKVEPTAVNLDLITELEPQVPEFDIYLCFKGTDTKIVARLIEVGVQMGVKHFIPLQPLNNQTMIKERVITATELSKRTDLPKLRGFLNIETVFNELNGNNFVVVSKEKHDSAEEAGKFNSVQASVLFIATNQDWTLDELEIFKRHKTTHLSPSKFHTDTIVEVISVIAKLSELYEHKRGGV